MCKYDRTMEVLDWATLRTASWPVDAVDALRRTRWPLSRPVWAGSNAG